MNFVVKEHNNITQYLYGGDGFDIRYLTKVSYPILLSKTALFEEKYHFKSSNKEL